MCGVYPDANAKVAGDEISSTYEGRHLTFFESELTHLTHSPDLVHKGDPVVVGTKIVGVAFKSAVAASDLITIDTEGIWVLSVVAKDFAGNSPVVPGDRLYIDTGIMGLPPCIVNKVSHEEYTIPFGYALGSINAGETKTIAVKVHAGHLVAAVIKGNKILDGNLSAYGAFSFNGPVGITGILTCGGGVTCNTTLGVVGAATFGISGSIVAHCPVWWNGPITTANLPLADPMLAGRLWRNGNVVTVSAA